MFLCFEIKREKEEKDEGSNKKAKEINLAISKKNQQQKKTTIAATKMAI